jgi:signal transduction histidine kinase
MAARFQSQSAAEAPEVELTSGPVLSRYLFQVEEAERRRLARELHDETSQGLTTVRFHLDTLQKNANPELQKTVDEAFGALDHTIEGLRRIVSRLSPQALEKLGLIGSLRKEARTLTEDYGIAVDLRLTPNLGRLSHDAELALYRLVQEALHNVAKHAHASKVEIDLGRKDGKVVLVIQDDGVGLNKKIGIQHSSFGIFGMRERVRCLNGTFRIRSRHGRGTRIEVYLDHSLCVCAAPQANQFEVIEGKARRQSAGALKQRRNATGARNGQNQVFARG